MDSVTTDRVFTMNALNLIHSCLDHSESVPDFFAEVDALASDSMNTLALPGTVEFTQALDPSDDGQNAAMVYDAIGALDRSNAADPRRWTYMALKSHRDYMSARWSLETARNWKGRARDRWLIVNPTRRGLVRHGIARLWWSAELTRDTHMERALSHRTGDPYAYTRWLFESEDRVQAIFERELGSNSAVMWTVLESLEADSVSNKGQAAKDLAKEVRVLGAYRNLEVLDEGRRQEVIAGLSVGR